MTTLDDILDGQDLARCLDDRLVVARKHPSAPLVILNYTERCQYERGLWNAVTMQCRGLIYHAMTREIVARPFRKFFNYGQEEAPAMPLHMACFATDKLDGSLGILYRANDGWAIATRGSFDGDQARHATAVLRSRYASYMPPEGGTVLFEIIYPENRIVLDYGQQDDLSLLGYVDIATGRTFPPIMHELRSWEGPRATIFPYATVADALAAPMRPNAEGIVIHLIETDERVKIKQADYVALHKIVSGLNERAVWEHCAAGKDVGELLSALPDEFHEWVRAVAARLHATVTDNAAEIESAYSTILAALPADHTRKDFALVAKEHPQRAGIFARLDGKDYHPGLWAAIKPSARLGPRGLAPSEDAA